MSDKIHPKKHKLFLYVISVVVLIVVGTVEGDYYLKQKDAIHIAFVGPLSGPNKTQGMSLLRGIQLYIRHYVK